MSSKMKDVILIISYILFGVLTRTVWHIAPNVEFVTAFSIAGAYFIRKKYSVAIPFGIMAISDFLIGNTLIYLFTWSAFGIAWIFGKVMLLERVQQVFKKAPNIVSTFIMSELGGILFTLFFFLWTNFGVVVVSNLYPKTFEGLIQSYIMGLPFLVPQLVGNVIIVPAVFVITQLFYQGNFKVLEGIRCKVLSKG